MKLIKRLFIISLLLVSFRGHTTSNDSCTTDTDKPDQVNNLWQSTAPIIYSLKQEARPFKTDGCTMFIDQLKFIDKNWRACCVEHDFRYWIGGEKSKQDHADLKLKECLSVRASKAIATLMYKSVRLGHLSPVKHPTKWGWGQLSLGDKDFILEVLLKVEDQLYSKEELVEELVK